MKNLLLFLNLQSRMTPCGLREAARFTMDSMYRRSDAVQ